MSERMSAVEPFCDCKETEAISDDRPHSEGQVRPTEATLKVALATLYPVDATRIAGGVRTVAHHLVQGLKEFPDLDIHVVHCHSEVTQNRDVIERNVTLHYRTLPGRRIIPNTVIAVDRVRGILEALAPAIVNPHESHYAVAALRAHLPVVYTVHGVPSREAPSYAHKGLSERLRFCMERYYSAIAMRQVEHAIAISPYVMREYEGRSRAQWHRIDNPLPEEFFNLQSHERDGQVLFVGTITEVKDILCLLQAVAIINRQPEGVPCRLRLAGRTTSPQYEQMLTDYVRQNRLQEVVTFLGMLDHDMLLQEYAQCAVVALPSRQENAPMAIIEAMAVGKPVVATRVGGIPDLVQEGETGLLVDAGDAVGLARSLVTLLSDATLRRQMGARARQQANARFRLEQVARKYRQVYYLVAAESRHFGGESRALPPG
jgi:glycosyltransferase involved in cell wall biosynthesis